MPGERSRRRREAATPAERTSRYAFADLIGSAPVLREALSLARAAAAGPIPGRSSSSARAAPARSWSPTPSTERAGGPTAPSSPSTAARSLGSSSRASSSATRRARSPARAARARRESSRPPTGARSSSTRWTRCPYELQAKFLRVLEGGEVVRLGSATPVRGGRARRGRLQRRSPSARGRGHVPTRPLPPARRGGDLPAAAPRAARGHPAAGRQPASRRRRARPSVSPLTLRPEVAACLEAYHWPGNVRELRNLCARWAVTVEGARCGSRTCHATCARPSSGRPRAACRSRRPPPDRGRHHQAGPSRERRAGRRGRTAAGRRADHRSTAGSSGGAHRTNCRRLQRCFTSLRSSGLRTASPERDTIASCADRVCFVGSQSSTLTPSGSRARFLRCFDRLPSEPPESPVVRDRADDLRGR